LVPIAYAAPSDTGAGEVDLDHRTRERLRISCGPATAAAVGPAVTDNTLLRANPPKGGDAEPRG